MMGTEDDVVEQEEDGGSCPECGGILTTLWRGVKCNNCGYWFCI